MRRTLAAVALGLGLAACVGAGCTLLIGGGADYFVADGGPTTGSGGQSAASTASSGGSSTASSGAAGSVASNASSTVSTTASSSSGTGGDAGSSCLVDAGACGPGMRCTVLDPTTGSTHCVPVSGAAVGAFSPCGNDDMCAAGTWCDFDGTGVCKPFCATPADCAPGAQCVAADWNNGPIPGIRVCTAHCKPDHGNPPCGPGTACQVRFDFDCVSSMGQGAGTSCPNQSISTCGPGLVCNDAKVCTAWCAPVNASSPDCPDGGVCKQFTNGGPFYGSTEYGYCP